MRARPEVYIADPRGGLRGFARNRLFSNYERPPINPRKSDRASLQINFGNAVINLRLPSEE